MVEPSSLFSNLSGAITSVVTTSNIVLGLRNCPEEVKTCVSHIKLVHDDIQHAVTLRTKHRELLAQRPTDAKRIDDIIVSASASLTSIGVLVERLRAEAYGGKVPYPKKLRWVLGDSTSFALRTRDLQAQHTAVQGEIAWLRWLELMGPFQKHEEPTTSFENLDLWKSKEAEYEIGKFEPKIPFSTPELPSASALHRVTSSQTLAYSTSDISIVPPSYTSQWVENNPTPYQAYSKPHGYAELLASTTYPEQLTPDVTKKRATLEPIPDPIREPIPDLIPSEEEHDDEMGSFFRSWKEEQVERKRENEYSKW